MCHFFLWKSQEKINKVRATAVNRGTVMHSAAMSTNAFQLMFTQEIELYSELIEIRKSFITLAEWICISAARAIETAMLD